MRKLWVAALCAAGLLTAGQASATSIVTVDFTVTPGTWSVDPAVPSEFGITPGETFTGSFSYDLDLLHQEVNFGADADALLTAFSVTVGDITYSLGDIGLPGAAAIVGGDFLQVDGTGAPVGWKFQPESAGGLIADFSFSPFGGVVLDLFDAQINIATGDNTGTQTVTLPTGPAVPEPASWALMITGLGMAGAALRRRRAMIPA